MLHVIKANAIYVFYIIGLFFIYLSCIGKVKYPLLFMIALMPLRNVIEKLHTLPLGKDLLDILFIFLILGWFIGNSSKGHKIFDRSPINAIAIIMVMYMFFSLLQGSFYLNNLNAFALSDPRVQEWKNFATMPLLFFLVFNNIRDKKWIWITVTVMCLVMVLMDYYLVQQIRWFSSLVSRKKINATFYYLGPNEVAAFYNMYTVILFSVFLSMKKGINKMLLLGLIVINLFGILFLYSRAAYAATAVGLFLLFLIKDRKLLFVLIIMAVCWQTFLPQKVQERIGMTTNEYGELDESSATRLTLWEHSLDLFEQNPITGVGFGVFRYLGFELGDTHNVYLKILAEQGLIGIFIFLILLFVMFVQGIKLFMGGDDDVSRGLGLGFAIAIIVLMINNVFGDRWTYTEVSSNLWVFAGLVARYIIISRQKRLAALHPEEEQTDESETKKVSPAEISDHDDYVEALDNELSPDNYDDDDFEIDQTYPDEY